MSVLEVSIEKMEVKHYPVMYREVLDLLDIRSRTVIVDCTLGVGSHALKFFEVMKKDALLIGIDKDEESLKIAQQRLKPFEGRFILVNSDFSRINSILEEINIKGVDVFFFDLGISTYQLNNSERGFSFLKEGHLDMRMDRNAFLSAYDLINNLGKEELENIFRKFGEERYSHRIAQFIVEKRKREPIATTGELTQVILSAVPFRSYKSRRHPATRIFQALRIAVNRELESLQAGISKAIVHLNKGGRVGCISFHSLEDRIVKYAFRDASHSGDLKIITKKPVIPSGEEKEENFSSRSGKLRVAEKIS